MHWLGERRGKGLGNAYKSEREREYIEFVRVDKQIRILLSR